MTTEKIQEAAATPQAGAPPQRGRHLPKSSETEAIEQALQSAERFIEETREQTGASAAVSASDPQPRDASEERAA